MRFTLRSVFMLLLMAVFTNSALLAAVPASSYAGNATTASLVPASTSTVTLSKKEKRAKKAALKQRLKELKANLKSGNLSEADTVLLVILSILLPPLAVFLYEGSITSKFWISLILTLLFWVPGVIYSLLVVLGVV